MNARLLDTALATCAAALATGGTLLLVARMNQVPDAPPRPSSTPARSIPLSSAPQPPDALENLPEPEPRLEAASVTESQALRPLTPSALPSLSGKAALAGLGALTGMALGSLGAPAVAASASAGPADRPARPLRRPRAALPGSGAAPGGSRGTPSSACVCRRPVGSTRSSLSIAGPRGCSTMSLAMQRAAIASSLRSATVTRWRRRSSSGSSFG
jgi:hypothetical protein